MDFMISNSGDLVLEDKTRSKQLEFTFRISQNPGLEVTFHILNEKEPIENKGLKFVFDVTKDSDLAQNVKVIKDIEEKMQLIRIALMTELGELKNKDKFGSQLKLYSHKDIHADTTIESIKKTVMKCIEGILNEPKVKVVPENGSGNLYFHNMSIFIFEGGTQIFKFYV